MPLGMAVDGDKVSYVSTKNGSLGLYHAEQNSTLREIFMPIWKPRVNPIDFSQVWKSNRNEKWNVSWYLCY